MNKFLVCHNHITVASARQERSLAGRIWSSNFSNNGLHFRYASNLFIWVSTFHQQLSEYSPSGRRREGGCELNTLNSLFQPEHHVKVNKMRNLWVKLWLFCSLFLVCLFIIPDASLCSAQLWLLWRVPAFKFYWQKSSESENYNKQGPRQGQKYQDPKIDNIYLESNLFQISINRECPSL